MKKTRVMRLSLLLALPLFYCLTGCHIVTRSEQCRELASSFNQADAQIEILRATSTKNTALLKKQPSLLLPEVSAAHKQAKAIIVNLNDSLRRLDFAQGEMNQKKDVMIQHLQRLQSAYARPISRARNRSRHSLGLNAKKIQIQVVKTQKLLQELQKSCQ